VSDKETVQLVHPDGYGPITETPRRARLLKRQGWVEHTADSPPDLDPSTSPED